MANTFTRLITHIVFSTKDRAHVLPGKRDDLYSYIGGILRNTGGKSLAINGTEDHIHILTYFSCRTSVSELVKTVKSNSSRWLHETEPLKKFSNWQTGYAAFSVDGNSMERVRRYIERQEEHHRTKSFKEELVDALNEAGIEYDERYLWD